MYIASKQDANTPLYAPSGEIIYELIGATESTGGAVRHSVALVIIPPGKSSHAHYHRVSEETYYILCGAAQMVIDEHTFQLAPGQACLIRPGERHQIFNLGGEDLEFIAVCAPPWEAGDSVFVDQGLVDW
jgi:mannose-6-phosphate isomerase-like protein (cupin superfamily)